jgi:hypothetical protein
MVGAALVLASCGAAVASDAKQARCSTTDDGTYPCEFTMTDANGSFEISAPGKPTYALNIAAPGVAYGFVTIDATSTPLPGRYLRSEADRACWRNDATDTEICAW